MASSRITVDGDMVHSETHQTSSPFPPGQNHRPRLRPSAAAGRSVIWRPTARPPRAAARRPPAQSSGAPTPAACAGPPVSARKFPWKTGDPTVKSRLPHCRWAGSEAGACWLQVLRRTTDTPCDVATKRQPQRKQGQRNVRDSNEKLWRKR